MSNNFDDINKETDFEEDKDIGMEKKADIK